MIYLIGEIVLYLLVALLIGAVTGWLLRGSRTRDAQALAGALPILPAPLVEAPRTDDGRVAELEAALAGARALVAEANDRAGAQSEEASGLARKLATAERRLEELERERALQNRALQVLHQQLEFALERREPRSAYPKENAA